MLIVVKKIMYDIYTGTQHTESSLSRPSYRGRFDSVHKSKTQAWERILLAKHSFKLSQRALDVVGWQTLEYPRHESVLCRSQKEKLQSWSEEASPLPGVRLPSVFADILIETDVVRGSYADLTSRNMFGAPAWPTRNINVYTRYHWHL